AAGGDIPHFVGNAVLGNGRQRVAAARDGKRGRAGDGLGHHFGALGKRVELEHAHGPVPYDGAGSLQDAGPLRGGLRADVEDEIVVSDRVGRLDGGPRIGGERLGAHHVYRNGNLGAALFHELDDGAGFVDLVGLGQRLADRQAGGQHERVGDASATTSRSTL